VWEYLSAHPGIFIGAAIGTLASLLWFVHRRLKVVEVRHERELRTLSTSLRELQRWGGIIDERLSDVEDHTQLEDPADEPRRDDPESSRVTSAAARTAWQRLDDED